MYGGSLLSAHVSYLGRSVSVWECCERMVDFSNQNFLLEKMARKCKKRNKQRENWRRSLSSEIDGIYMDIKLLKRWSQPIHLNEIKRGYIVELSRNPHPISRIQCLIAGLVRLLVINVVGQSDAALPAWPRMATHGHAWPFRGSPRLQNACNGFRGK